MYEFRRSKKFYRILLVCKCLEFWENEKLNIIYLERARKSLSFFVAKIKERRKMSDNIEIVMDIAVNKSPSAGDKKG